MMRIDKMLEFMQRADVGRLDITCVKGMCRYRGDNNKSFKGEIPENHITELLMEIIPAEHAQTFAQNRPVQFDIVSNDTPMQISASRSDGTMTMQIQLPKSIEAASVDFQPPADPSFQIIIPSYLRWTEQKVNVFSATLGILLGLGASAAAFSLSSRQSLLGQMFNLNSIMALAPVSMSCLFFWGAILCMLRWMRLRENESLSSKPVLAKVTSGLGSMGLSGIIKYTGTPDALMSPLLRRVQAIVRQWAIRANLQDAALLLDHQELYDEDAIKNGYGILRVFVWALPVLGLIGTVVGIALAVGNFAQFLGTNIDDVSLIKKSLVSVTGGLSYAFMNTLQGLLSSLLLMIPTSAMQAREERLVSTIRRDISDIFLPTLQRRFPESAAGGDIRGEKSFQETLKRVTEDVLTKFGDTTSHIVHKVEEQIRNWALNLRTETEEGARRISDVVGKIGKDLEASSNDFLARLSMVQDSWNQHTAVLSQLVEQQSQANSKIHTDLLKAAETHHASAENMGRALNGLADTTKAALQAQTVLQTSIENLSRANFNQSMDAVTSALKDASSQTVVISRAMEGLADTGKKILDSQQMLQNAVSQLHETGLSKTLDKVASSLEQVSVVLAKFKEPMVFQAVPISNLTERKA